MTSPSVKGGFEFEEVRIPLAGGAGVKRARAAEVGERESGVRFPFGEIVGVGRRVYLVENSLALAFVESSSSTALELSHPKFGLSDILG